MAYVGKKQHRVSNIGAYTCKQSVTNLINNAEYLKINSLYYNTHVHATSKLLNIVCLICNADQKDFCCLIPYSTKLYVHSLYMVRDITYNFFYLFHVTTEIPSICIICTNFIHYNITIWFSINISTEC